MFARTLRGLLKSFVIGKGGATAPQILLGKRRKYCKKESRTPNRKRRLVPATGHLRRIDTIIRRKGESLRNMLDLSIKVAVVTKNIQGKGETGTLGGNHARALRRGLPTLGVTRDTKNRKRHLR